MIERLKGLLVEKQPPGLVVDVHGVGYELQAPMSTFYKLPPVGESVLLYTHFVVREDAQLLFGFVEPADRRLFRTLIRVSGVGPKLALAILSGMDAGEFIACVQRADSVTLTRLPGVGKRTAERLLVEMRDRIHEWGIASVEPATSAAGSRSRGVREDAENALIALGYKPQEATRAIERVVSDELDSSEELIRLALKSMLPVERKLE